MKFIDVLNNVDKSDKNTSYQDPYTYCADFGFDDFYIDREAFAEAVKGYYYASWLCTDTHVGGAAIYLNGELIGSTWQPARKSNEEVEYLSKSAADKMKEFLLSILDQPECFNVGIYSKEDLEEEVGGRL